MVKPNFKEDLWETPYEGGGGRTRNRERKRFERRRKYLSSSWRKLPEAMQNVHGGRSGFCLRVKFSLHPKNPMVPDGSRELALF
jgi:coproporphyrinogen III oxidase